MFTIHLNKLLFFARHGLHEGESVTGTNFEINVSIQFDVVGKIDSIQQTINYAEVYALIKRQLETAVPLLEILAQNITGEIYLLNDQIRKIDVNIIKLNPPISNFSGNVGVSYSKEF